MYEELVKRLREHGEFLIVSDRMNAPPNVNVRNVFAEDYYQAADALEELSKPRWTSVTERLPEPYTWVLVFAEKHEVAFDAYYDGAQWKDAFLNGLVVTHWMPLPEPPKEETNERT